MPENALNSVIEVEIEIHSRLEAERERAKSWLERVRREVEAELRERLEALTAPTDEAGDESHRAAAEETASVVRRAEQLAEQLAAVGDAVLEGIVHRHLAVIIQGAGHDRPDDQG